ncbi:MAG TPA: hypothetical protein ENF93_00695 [Ignisphaera sp.]|nr:hypothetical protein [Ignisphaera sp.]
MQIITLAIANTTTPIPTINLPSLIGSLLANPGAYITMLIEFLLGLGLGYVAMRALKYMLATVGIIFLGIVLGVWSLGNSIYDAIKYLEMLALNLWEIAYTLFAMLGLLVIGPVTIGFIVGALIAHMRK